LTRDLVVAPWGDGIGGALLEDGWLLDWVAAPADGAGQPGAVHLARVAQTRPELGLVFVALEGGVEASLDLGADPPRPGDTCLVQIVAAARSGKPARASIRPAFAGRFVVLRRGAPTLRLPATMDPAEAARFAALRDVVPECMSASLRSAACGADPDRVRAELLLLAQLWARVVADAAARRAPALLHAPHAALRATLPLLRARPRRVLVADRKIQHVLGSVGLEASSADAAGAALFDQHDVATQLASADAAAVPLSSGGSLSVETTRALTVIDVDGGSDGDAGRVNRGAVREIARQIRLRDVRGTIVVDFLRTGEASRRAVADALGAAVAIDRRRVGLLGWTRGGLYEMRRSDELDDR
jgi:Rne/Rng family ribonuclease